MIDTSQDYPLVALIGSMAIVLISLELIWNGSL